MNLFPLQITCSALSAALLSTVASAQIPAPTNSLAQTTLPRVELHAGMHRIDAQVAAQFKERQIGLMHRTSMPTNEGMLFVFERHGIQCFWMKDTLIPLTAAFIADDGTIINLVDMQPRDESSHCSERPVRFVLEMNQGWFNRKNILPGSKLSGVFFHEPTSSMP